jgi:hypothetical protein
MEKPASAGSIKADTAYTDKNAALSAASSPAIAARGFGYEIQHWRSWLDRVK